jgi:hypothetical protein
LLETKNKSNSLPETARVGEIATLYSRKDSRNPKCFEQAVRRIQQIHIKVTK